MKVPDQALPDESDVNAQWWQLAEAWGGNSKSEIVEAVNTALAGERYSHEALLKYLD